MMYKGKFVSNAPKSTPPAPSAEEGVQTPKKKKISKSTIVFYSIYFVLVIAAVVGIFMLLSPLQDWLVRYEASQPEQARQQVYTQYFSQPDWAVLYETAGITDTTFEGKEAYAAYMNDKVAKAENPVLSVMETSAGLSGDHKYIVSLDSEKVASFTLVEAKTSEADVPTWELGGIELFFTRTQSVTVEKLPEHTVYINDVALDESYTIRTISTKAEAYLPEGLHGYRREQQSVSGLLVAPTVTILDANGENVPVYTDPNTGMIRAQVTDTPEMTQEEEEIVLEASRNYALFAIRKISIGALRSYVDPKSELYSNVVYTPPFLQAFTGYKFQDGMEVSDFYRYSDKLFSARIHLKMDVYAARGNTKVFDMDITFFFTKQANGKYLITDSTNVKINEQVQQVRMTFMNDDTLVDSYMIDATSATVTLPQVTAPQGKVLKGWAVQTVEENGSINMTILYTPTESGTVNVPADTDLEPVTLYAVFEVGE